MTIKQIGAATAISLAGIASALAVGAGTAAAAPSGTSAPADTMVRWQADGNRVAVNEAGTVPMEDCTVASDRPVQTRPAPTANPLTDVPVIQQTATVHVALNC
jgi:hypothetical protein